MSTRLPDPIEALESIVIGSVAMTALAVGDTRVDLTFPQWRALLIVGETPDGATVSQVAGRLGAALSPTSRLIGRLERRGLLLAEKDSADRRATRVRLSREGDVLRGRILDARRHYLSEALDGVGALPDTARQALGSLAVEFMRRA